jgi:uncharacterized membrane protein YkvA (DUF1232 family)
MLALLVVGYALSPIDLIPDFIPVLGYIDDLVLLPLGMLMVIRLIPADLMAECRAAADRSESPPRSWKTAAVIMAVWLLAIGMTVQWLLGIINLN